MLALLLARLGDARAAPLTRSAAAAYAGSFLARAAFVPPPLVVSAVHVSSRRPSPSRCLKPTDVLSALVIPL